MNWGVVMGFSRRDFYLAQGGKCFYCGKFVSAFPYQQGNNVRGYTIDHFYPKSKTIPVPTGENKVLSCYKCNLDKAAQLPNTTQIRKYTRLINLLRLV